MLHRSIAASKELKRFLFTSSYLISTLKSIVKWSNGKHKPILDFWGLLFLHGGNVPGQRPGAFVKSIEPFMS